MIQIGSLVRSLDNELGTGKVVQQSYQDAVIEYFCSVGQCIEETVPLSELRRVTLQRQTRCYVKLEQGRWAVGRIFGWDESNEAYQIDLPDSKTLFASEEDVYVRCSLPIEDPIEILAMKGQETPYFHQRRFAFVKNLTLQRAVSRGMTGLISANIELLRHQVEVVRRVLEDPIQRYLLADEVGLGKTIEAGAILRQYLLDEPERRAVVLAPQYLIEQWRTELKNKFYLSHFPDRVVVSAIEDVHKVNTKADIGLLIIDEAHHVAAMARSSNAAQRSSFGSFKTLAHQSERLLLLSATPVVNNEQDFLAMLHLLDPTSYKLDDLEGFRERVAKRQDIGRVLLSFKEGANPFVLKNQVTQLCSLFPDDKYLLDLAEKLQTSLQNSDTNQANKIVRVIRTHISDTYRLFRRMLRNRRASVEDVIFDRNVAPKAEYDLDERVYDLHELIEEWRGLAPDSSEYQRIFLLLFRASGTWLGILHLVVSSRLRGILSQELTKEFDADSLNILVKTPKFNKEVEILQGIIRVLDKPSEDGDRLVLLRIVILYKLSENFKLQSFRSNLPKLLEQVQLRLKRPVPGDRLPKIVIFTSYVKTCGQIVKFLRDSFGEVAIASHQFGEARAQVEKSLDRFKNDANCFTLVCDYSGEEGRNLQFADAMIHFDLPWSPNRLEQRIGRIDRIGRQLNVEFTVFAGAEIDDSPHDAWYQLLKDGFNVFEQSIASFQFYVDEKLPQLEATLFKSGANGLLESIEQVKQEIGAELVKIEEQNALDEIDAFDETASEYFESLDDFDAKHQEIERVTEDWICNALRLKQLNDPNIQAAQRYEPTSKTLIPIDDLRTYFVGLTNDVGTYNRRVANQKPHVNLYRIGEGLIDSLSSYIHWDDRGQAFAMWRVDDSWDAGEGMEWFGFRFDYIIETDLTSYKLDPIKYKALQRRADSLFPPIIQSIFIDARNEPMSIVEDKPLLDILQRPYRAKGKSPIKPSKTPTKGAVNQDYNLAKSRLSILDNFVDPDEWQNFCRDARNTSVELLLSQASFIEQCEKAAAHAEQKLSRRLEQLRLRLNRIKLQEKIIDKTLTQEVIEEAKLNQAIIEGIRHPNIRLDSVGFIIVSGRPPVQGEEEDY
ncbi:MAG: helicase [Calothrix sp. C42_A2020_038]|nr:helicase [Calothrix sp. C42_A2020_038]